MHSPTWAALSFCLCAQQRLREAEASRGGCCARLCYSVFCCPRRLGQGAQGGDGLRCSDPDGHPLAPDSLAPAPQHREGSGGSGGGGSDTLSDLARLGTPLVPPSSLGAERADLDLHIYAERQRELLAQRKHRGFLPTAWGIDLG